MRDDDGAAPRRGGGAARRPARRRTNARDTSWWQGISTDPLFAQCPFGLGVLTPAGRILTVNGPLAELHGATAEELADRPIATLDGPLSHPEVQEAVLRLVETGEALSHQVIRGSLRGTTQPYLCTLAVWPIRGDDGLRGIGVTLNSISGDESVLSRLEHVRARLALVNEVELRMGFSQDVVGCAEQLPLVTVPSFADVAAIALFETPVPLSVLPENGFDPPDGALLRTVAAVLHPDITELKSVTPKDYARPFAVPPEVRAALRRQRAEASGTDAGPRGGDPGPAIPTNGTRPGPDAPPLRGYLVEAGLHSQIVAPLISRGRALGAAMFARVGDSPAFDADDVQTAEELGLRAAASIDKAQAHVKQRQAVRTLQRHLLPRNLPTIDGLAFSYAYQPARTDRLAGGDWYDVIPLPEGRVALVVGDVTGHGLQAAALMGQLRVAVRAVARLGLPPAALLSHVDSLMDDFAVDGELASCVYAVYDTKEGVLTWARAGHPPPLLHVPGAPTRMLDGPPNALLGIGGITFDETSCAVPAGACVVLYSDGLVERRGYDIDTGIKDLRAVLDTAVSDAPATPNLLRDAALRVLPAGPEDDVALLIAALAT
ncbi:SpoIIE family protein phosphatase [Yinghuangia sp. ASG 101]|uniref:SpoIIE family protein phosphatase n=1 Tax=Yinghuangia sp. ASG 101 TaxID=2896848 RepID=UPI001E30BC22|nr:SpoIIE family protein phosphatase [Yinghuangia sp. ASG 101]UGQ10310.1 SpoIIE family protein phosphatase [Yinghuangia sp. ASG 101]